VMVVNQNYESGWHLVEGTGALFSYNGLLGIYLPAGHQRLKIVFRDVPLIAGAAVTLLTCIVALVVWRRESALAIRNLQNAGGHRNT